MYISHLLVPPLLLHRFLPSKVSPTTLALASVAPDLISNMYSIAMDMLRMLPGVRERIVIHDKKRPPGWIDAESGRPIGIGDWAHGFGGGVFLALSLALLTGIYYATRKSTHTAGTAPTTPPATPAAGTATSSTEQSGSKLAIPEIFPFSSKLSGLTKDPHIARSMMAVGIAVMSHALLDKFGGSPNVLFNPFSNAVRHQSKSPSWTFTVDSLLALTTTYFYTLHPHITAPSRLRLAGLCALLMMIEGNLYLPRPTSLVPPPPPNSATTVPTTSPWMGTSMWSMIREVAGAALVGAVLGSIPHHLGSQEAGGVREILEHGMRSLKGAVGPVKPLTDLPFLPDTPPDAEEAEAEKKSQAAPQQQQQQQEKRGEQQPRGKRDSGFYEYEQDRDRAEMIGGENGNHGGGESERYAGAAGVRESIRLNYSPLGHSQAVHAPGHHLHGTYAEVAQGKKHEEESTSPRAGGYESPVFVDKPGGGMGGAGSGMTAGKGKLGGGEGGGTRRAYIH